MMTATTSWSTRETDPQRLAILAAADRLLAGTARRSTGNLSVVQLAAEAEVKYWVVAQKHPDLRDHFQRLAAQQQRATAEFRENHDAVVRLQREHLELKKHCAGLEELIRTYATVINELTQENHVLREQATISNATVTPLKTYRTAQT
jgi:chromosome segregation ATPase